MRQHDRPHLSLVQHIHALVLRVGVPQSLGRGDVFYVVRDVASIQIFNIPNPGICPKGSIEVAEGVEVEVP